MLMTLLTQSLICFEMGGRNITEQGNQEAIFKKQTDTLQTGSSHRRKGQDLDCPTNRHVQLPGPVFPEMQGKMTTTVLPTL